jgi:hypothetical protein
MTVALVARADLAGVVESSRDDFFAVADGFLAGAAFSANTGASALVAAAFGALAFGALAFGALAFGALAFVTAVLGAASFGADFSARTVTHAAIFADATAEVFLGSATTCCSSPGEAF